LPRLYRVCATAGQVDIRRKSPAYLYVQNSDLEPTEALANPENDALKQLTVNSILPGN
jgi:hypothetical protein